MTGLAPRLIELTEFEPRALPQDALSEEVARFIWDNHSKSISVAPPTFLNAHQWRLTSLGHVGCIPLAPELTLVLRPKVPIGNLFRMLEIAYQVDFKTLPGLMTCASLEEFYERLAIILAKRILDRERKGLFCAYVGRTESLGFVRGRLRPESMVRRPWSVQIECEFEEHTTNIEDNQILAWTLWSILQSGMCTDRVRPTLRQAWRGLSGATTFVPFEAASCVGRTYNRLNADYQPLHALCRFFLDQSGPEHSNGGRVMLPFIVDMAVLFERFVAEWLKSNLSPRHALKPQFHFRPEDNQQVEFIIDLLLCDTVTGKALCVLDTKYKRADTPSTEDIAQVVAYAESQGCRKAVLVYPCRLSKPLKLSVGRISVVSMSFDLAGYFEEAGEALRKEIEDFISAA